ncbi:monooxygenase [Chryseobacterium phosphatilyticum]|uniref:Monooxygenase n=1 Tax=Chryseobacterium phosphatilyticum TaxID=475075 RepID=A0A316X8Y3_9FLAO|nr:FAD-dependent monooxygenase [Chryseobacterium phosphatilyticum]PWN70222.1 monooxygenase [Chryseobacterium phosphatilyticum]
MIKNNEMSISIVGKGIGGLTLAYALEQSGYHNITIYEQSTTIEQSTKGSGIMLACNAMQIMKKLGLHEELKQEGNILKRMNITNENLKVLSCVNIEPFSKLYGVDMVAIHREKLYNIITSKIKSPTLLGKKLDRITAVHNQLNMHFEDSTLGTSDMIIGADGVNSKVRDSYFPEITMRDSGQLCWRGIAHMEMSEFEEELNELWGKGKRFGFVKINNHQVYWYALINNHGQYTSVSLNELNDLYTDFHPIVLEIISNTHEDEIITRQIKDFKTPELWHKNNVCLIGDAAHAMTPNLGQGACQAIEDAYVFSECLKRYESEEALAQFNKIRGSKASWVVERSRKIGKMSQLNNATGIWLRNTIMSAIPSQLAYGDTKKMLDIYSYESIL